MENAMLAERLKPVVPFPPIDTTGAGQDGDWMNFKHHRRALVCLIQGAWAGGTSAVTLEQAQDNAATGAKALEIEQIWRGTALTDDVYERIAVVANTFTLPNTANTFTFFEVRSHDLDIQNGFTHFRVRCATPGANADLLAALVIFGDPVYLVLPPDQPSVIA